VPSAQAKAAKFLAQLAAAAAEGVLAGRSREDLITAVTGATASGPAHAHVAGQGAQRALVVSPKGPWGVALEALRAEAARRGAGTMLCDERTRHEAEHAVVVRAHSAHTVELPKGHVHLGSPPSTDSRRSSRAAADPHAASSPEQPAALSAAPDEGDGTTLRVAAYAIVAACDDGGDEWMYVLQEREARDAEAARIEQLQLWVRGAAEAPRFSGSLTGAPADLER